MYSNWLGALSDREREAHLKRIEDALGSGKAPDLDMSFIESDEISAFYDKQQKLVAKIKETFDQELSELEKEEKATVLASAINKSTPNKKAKGGNGCFEGYNACSWSCHENSGSAACREACWAGYISCERVEPAN